MQVRHDKARPNDGIYNHRLAIKFVGGEINDLRDASYHAARSARLGGERWNDRAPRWLQQLVRISLDPVVSRAALRYEAVENLAAQAIRNAQDVNGMPSTMPQLVLEGNPAFAAYSAMQKYIRWSTAPGLVPDETALITEAIYSNNPNALEQDFPHAQSI